MLEASMSSIKINLNKEILPYGNYSAEPESLDKDRLVSLNAENYANKQKTNSLLKNVDYFSATGIIFAFLAPPIGIIISYLARRRAINNYKSTFTSTLGLAVASFLSLVILGFAGFAISRNFEKTLDTQDSASTSSSSNPPKKDYTPSEKSALDQTNKFLSAIKEENYSQAFSLLGPELRKEYSQGEAGFESELKSANLKLIDSWDITSVSTNNKGDRFTVKGNARFKGATPSAKFELSYYKANDGSVKMFLWQISPDT